MILASVFMRVLSSSLPRRLKRAGWPVFRLGVALCCAGVLLSGAAEAKSKDDRKKGGKGDDDKEEESGLQVPIPIGHSAEGIKLPEFGENGQIQMNFEIGSATRVNQTRLEMKDLEIETFNADGKAEMLILMPVSVFDLKSRVISSVDPVTIRRADLEVTGGNMEFDTRTRRGKFSGPTRMLIFNRDEFTSNAKTPESGEE